MANKENKWHKDTQWSTR